MPEKSHGWPRDSSFKIWNVASGERQFRKSSPQPQASATSLKIAKSLSAFPAGIDPVRFEVLRNALLAITEEMGATLRRAAYSTNIKTRGDFSCAFFDRELRTIAQAFAQPSHLGSLAHIVPDESHPYRVKLDAYRRTLPKPKEKGIGE